MFICSDSLLLIYDCRNYKGDYLCRALFALDSSDNLDDSWFHRQILDSDPVLMHSCTWKYKILDCSIVKDFGEFDYDA